MGEVYRATDSKLKRDVAIKVLPQAFTEDKERLARFEREAQLLAQLHHPNIASIFGMEEAEGTRALIMELVEGPTLAERLEQGPLPFNESLSVSLQIAQALEEAHEKGIVHRDLKPQNIKASKEGKTKVLDFGLAKAMDPAAGSAASVADLARSPTMMQSPTLTAAHGTQLGVILGTAAYMAPEQARGVAVDKRADIWAFGVVLYEMLTGRRLFEGELVTDVLASVLRKEIDFERLPADVPVAMRQLLRRCLERNPKNRLHDIADARIALEDLRARRDEGEPAAFATPALTSSRTRERLAWALAAAGLVAALVVSGAALWRSSPPERLLRASIDLPRGAALMPTGIHAGPVALSPDGTKVAFSARQGDGVAELWVRDLGAAEAHPLAGTDGAERPFWSPDSRQVGFFAKGSMKRIPAAGGPTRTLAPAFDPRGGSWNREGTIVFAPYYTGALMKVHEDGGKVEPVTTLDRARGENTHRYPHFLPGGKHLLFLARSSGAGAGKEPAIVLAALDGSERRVLFENASNVEYASGQILYAREQALYARPFHAERLLLGSGARAVIDDLLMDNRFSLGVFSASQGGVVAFQTGEVNDASQWVWRDREGRQLGALDEPGVYVGASGIELSPDGRRCAVPRVDPASGEAALWLVDTDRGTRSRISSPGSDSDSPVWSPDGERIVWASRGETTNRIVSRAVDGTGDTTALFEGPAGGDEVGIAFTPDGRHLLLQRVSPGSKSDILELSLAEGTSRPIVATEANEMWASLSLDGRWLAYASDESGPTEIYVAAYPSMQPRWQISRGGGVEPRWRGDGRALFYFAADNTLTEQELDLAGSSLSVGRVTRMFQVRDIGNWRYTVSRDGQRFLVNVPLPEDTTSPITIVTDWRRVNASEAEP